MNIDKQQRLLHELTSHFDQSESALKQLQHDNKHLRDEACATTQSLKRLRKDNEALTAENKRLKEQMERNSYDQMKEQMKPYMIGLSYNLNKLTTLCFDVEPVQACVRVEATRSGTGGAGEIDVDVSDTPSQDTDCTVQTCDSEGMVIEDNQSAYPWLTPDEQTHLPPIEMAVFSKFKAHTKDNFPRLTDTAGFSLTSRQICGTMMNMRKQRETKDRFVMMQYSEDCARRGVKDDTLGYIFLKRLPFFINCMDPDDIKASRKTYYNLACELVGIIDEVHCKRQKVSDEDDDAPLSLPHRK